MKLKAVQSVVLLVLVVPWVAGCFDEESKEEEPPAVRPDPEPDPIPTTWYMTANMTLTNTTPQGERPAARVPVAWSFAEYYSGAPPPFWETPATDTPLRIKAARAEVFFSSRGEAIDPGQGPGFTAWFGAADSVVSNAVGRGPQVIGRDEIVDMTFDFALPPGGLVVEPGESLRLHLGAFYVDAAVMTAGRRVQVMVDSLITPSHVYMEAEPVTIAGSTEKELLDEAGSLRGDACGTTPLPQTGEPEVRYQLEVPGEAVGLRVRLEGTQVTGGHDIDVELIGPDDAVVAAGRSPGGDESIDLFRVNLANVTTGAWTVRVFACQEQVSQFLLTVVALHPLRRDTGEGAIPA